MHAGIYPLGADTPRKQTPPRADTPSGTDPRAAGTHPTGMHSCLVSVDVCAVQSLTTEWEHVC